VNQLHTKEIEGREVSFGKINAVDGWRIIHRLAKVSGPMIDSLAKGELGSGIAKVMAMTSEDELLTLIRSLTADVLVDGKKWSNDNLADYGFTVLVVTEAVRYNFGGFFSPLMRGLQNASAKTGQ
jgi:hypothetical protein